LKSGIGWFFANDALQDRQRLIEGAIRLAPIRGEIKPDARKPDAGRMVRR
jgi:hypothetical protein